MKITYDKVSSYTKEPVFFLLTNNGNYFLSEIDSKYQGFFYYKNGRMFKIIDSISINKDVAEIKNNFFNVQQKRRSLSESFWLYNEVLIYEQNKAQEFELLLDVKESYDNRAWGRYYEVLGDVDGDIVIKFTKKTDSKEDNSNNVKEYELYLVIKGDRLEYKKTDKWIKKNYSFDKKRNSPDERYVYSCLKIKSKTAVFSVSDKLDKAIEESEYVFDNLKEIKNKMKENHKPLIKDIKHKELELAYKSALHSLDQLRLDDEGIIAGLPWFFQVWSRDELVSLKAFMIDNRFEFVKKILVKNLNNIQKDGRLLNQSLPNSDKTNADSIGWLFKRIEDYENLKGFSKEEIDLIKEKLAYSIDNIKKNYMENGLIRNNPLETWMDSEWSSDNRNGFRIEIQALFLNMLKFAYKLTRKKEYRAEEGRLKGKVRKEFFKNSVLIDGLNDEVIRPNLFIASYIYPQILKREEWAECFKIALDKLWLEWGGLSTMDKSNYLFCKQCTGEIPKSYHRGDSWFWINNLAALMMYKTDKIAFKEYIEKIIKADTEEIFLKGITGAHSELSSAEKLESSGCLNQAWSNAMFIELVNEIN